VEQRTNFVTRAECDDEFRWSSEDGSNEEEGPSEREGLMT
jgi:hypothetical protein